MRKKFAETEAGSGWMAAQWVSTAFLWTMWLQHDLANIAVFLPRSLGGGEFIAVAATIFFGLGLMLRQGGENIQEVVDEKSGVSDLRAATIINLVFAVILLVFKEWSSVPMSTTWVFIGLLAGREISLAVRKAAGDRTVKMAARMAAWDLTKVTAGFIVSIVVAALANDTFRAGLLGN
jgi:phosphate/sulfate permease